MRKAARPERRITACNVDELGQCASNTESETPEVESDIPTLKDEV